MTKSKHLNTVVMNIHPADVLNNLNIVERCLFQLKELGRLLFECQPSATGSSHIFTDHFTIKCSSCKVPSGISWLLHHSSIRVIL